MKYPQVHIPDPGFNLTGQKCDVGVQYYQKFGMRVRSAKSEVLSCQIVFTFNEVMYMLWFSLHFFFLFSILHFSFCCSYFNLQCYVMYVHKKSGVNNAINSTRMLFEEESKIYEIKSW